MPLITEGRGAATHPLNSPLLDFLRTVNLITMYFFPLRIKSSLSCLHSGFPSLLLTHVLFFKDVFLTFSLFISVDSTSSFLYLSFLIPLQKRRNTISPAISPTLLILNFVVKTLITTEYCVLCIPIAVSLSSNLSLLARRCKFKLAHKLGIFLVCICVKADYDSLSSFIDTAGSTLIRICKTFEAHVRRAKL